MTGRMNGAPSRVTSNVWPGTLRRASARATGTASITENKADRSA